MQLIQGYEGAIASLPVRADISVARKGVRN